jgi:hypothetical protein
LLGTGGAALALPMLESFLAREASGQALVPPKRLIVVMHPMGRPVGGIYSDDPVADIWSPRSTTGAYSSSLSPLLAGLGPVRDEIVTIDGIDNLARHLTGDADGHFSANLTSLTCRPFTPSGTAGGPSIDYVAGERVRASAAQHASLVFPASAMDAEWRYTHEVFYGAGGTQPTLVESNPALAIEQLFGAPEPPDGEPPPAKTLRDRLLGRRVSSLDAVAKHYIALSKTVSQADRERLEQHAAFLEAVRLKIGSGGGGVLAQDCQRPLESNVPAYDPSDNIRGQLDAQITPWTIENVVMALACDITRVACLHFQLDYDPTFPSEFSGTSPLVGTDWHSAVHGSTDVTGQWPEANTAAFQHFDKMFVRLIERLRDIVDVDGTRLLDNTLVMWVSDMGYGAFHQDFNVPVVLAGMKDAFSQGQGRHIVLSQRRSLGDLYAQVLRMLGESDTTFGATGTLAQNALSSDLNAWAGWPGHIEPSLPLHLGSIPL